MPFSDPIGGGGNLGSGGGSGGGGGIGGGFPSFGDPTTAAIMAALGGQGGLGAGGAYARRRMPGYYGQVQQMPQQPWWAQAQPYGAAPQRPEGMAPNQLSPQGSWLQQRQLPGAGGSGPMNPYTSTPLTGSDAEFWASHLLGGNLLYNLANQGYLVGNPANSPITEAYRQQAAQTSQAQQRRAQLAAQSMGLPQGQQGYAWLQGLLGGQGNEARGVNSLLRQQYQSQQDFARQLAQAAMGFQPQSKYRGPTDWSGVFGGLGQLGGAALGGLF